MNRILHRQKTLRLIFRFRMLDRWEVSQGLVKRLSFFLSGMHTMDPPMQGCFLRQVVEKEEPGRQG